jgi:hypothetical protein
MLKIAHPSRWRFLAVCVFTALAFSPVVASAMNWCVANRSRQTLVYVHAITVSPCKDYAPVGGDGDQTLAPAQTKRFSTGGCLVSQFEIRTQRSRGGGDEGDIKLDMDSNAQYQQAMNVEKTMAVVVEDSGEHGIRARWALAPQGGVVAIGDISCDAGHATAPTSTSWLRDSTTVMASDIAVGGGAVWAIGADVDVQGNHSILRRNNSSNQLDMSQWTTMPGRALRLSVDAQGNAWVVNAAGLIYRYNGTGWDLIPGQAKDISVGHRNGKVWAIGLGDQGGGNFNVWRRDGQTWTQVPGSGVRIAADNSGGAWLVNRAGQVWHFSNNSWQVMPGLPVPAVDVAVTPDDAVLAIDMNGKIFRFAGMQGWQQLTPDDPQRFAAVAVDDAGIPWGVALPPIGVSGGLVRHLKR